MLHLIPAPLHRLALKWAHGVRRRFRKIVKPDLYGVSLVLRDETGRVLLVRHSYGPPGWALPGGGIGRNENPAEGARREMREELGCELAQLRLFKTFSESISGSHHTGHLFTAKPVGEPNADQREILKTRWFTVEELARLDLTRLTRLRLGAMGFLGDLALARSV